MLELLKNTVLVIAHQCTSVLHIRLKMTLITYSNKQRTACVLLLYDMGSLKFAPNDTTNKCMTNIFLA